MHKVIIIGAGQAGLSTAYHLQKLGIQALIVDAHARVGDVWRRRWDSLSLFSPAKYSTLPGMSFPLPPLSLPTKDQVADYFEAYAKKFGFKMMLGAKVKSLSKTEQHFDLELESEVLNAQIVVVATGAFQTPFIPKFEHPAEVGIRQMHISSYQNPSDLQEGAVLVVGTGASGTQIAAEISQQHKVYLSGPNTPNMPRKRFGKDIYWWLYTTGIMHVKAKSWLGKRLFKEGIGADALIGKSLAEIVAENKLLRRGMLIDFEAGKPFFENSETAEDVRNIVWATGFKNDYSWIKLPVLDKQGRPKQTRGKAEEENGLYFVGMKFMYRADSSNMGGVGRDALWIATKIKETI